MLKGSGKFLQLGGRISVVLKIEFLYFDKSLCSRCKITSDNIEKSLKHLKSALNDFGAKFEFIEKKVDEGDIKKSQTIRINGKDIEEIINKNRQKRETSCHGCSKVIGKKVNCRSYFYKGKAYNFIPKSMIKEAIKISLLGEVK